MSGEFEDVDWARVYERQAARGGLVGRFCGLLGAGPGEDVIDLGCGPGHTAGRLAERVDPGRVYAVDRRPGALRYLRRETDPAGLVHPVVGDLTALPVRPGARSVLLAFVLHHLPDPPRAVAALGARLPAGATLLVVEYRPDAAGDVGPGLGARIEPAALEGWLAEAGLDVERSVELPEEKYAVRAGRR